MSAGPAPAGSIEAECTLDDACAGASSSTTATTGLPWPRLEPGDLQIGYRGKTETPTLTDFNVDGHTQVEVKYAKQNTGKQTVVVTLTGGCSVVNFDSLTFSAGSAN